MEQPQKAEGLQAPLRATGHCAPLRYTLKGRMLPAPHHGEGWREEERTRDAEPLTGREELAGGDRTRCRRRPACWVPSSTGCASRWHRAEISPRHPPAPGCGRHYRAGGQPSGPY